MMEYRESRSKLRLLLPVLALCLIAGFFLKGGLHRHADSPEARDKKSRSGIEAFNNTNAPGDVARGIEEITDAAKGGNAEAQKEIATAATTCAAGKITSQRIADECRLAAEAGDKTAQEAVGRLYAAGNYVEMDKTQAERYLRLAAEQGAPTAQIGLAQMYANGDGINQDHIEAAAWYTVVMKSAKTPEEKKAVAAISYLLDKEEAGLTQDQLGEIWTRAEKYESKYIH